MLPVQPQSQLQDQTHMRPVVVPVQEAPRTQVRVLPPNMDPRRNCLDLGSLDLDWRGGGGVGVNVVDVRGNPR